MAQVGQLRVSAMRYPARRTGVQARLATKRNKEQCVLLSADTFADQNDAALVAAADRGADGAFEVLVRRYQAKILCVAWRFTRNREDAEDITQQTFQKAFLHLRQFQGNSSFSTWLTRIAINEGLMWARRRRGSSEVPLETANGSDETPKQLELTDCAPNPEETCLQLERQQILAAALNRLKPKLRRAMELREFAELSTTETAALMGLSAAAVKARVFHGRTKLRALVKRYVGSKPVFLPGRRANGPSNQLVFACK